MSTEELSSLGDYLRTARERAGLSQRQAATLAGIHHSYLARLESGEVATRPDVEKLQSLCDAIGAEITEALAFIGVKPSLPEPNVYFRRKFGVDADEAEVLAQLVEEFRERKQKGGNDEDTN